MIEAFITGIVTLVVCMINNHYQQKQTRESSMETINLISYRLKTLEDEVRMHNNFARRMPVVEEKINVANHRIEDLEKERK
ncbi:hypothetical protein INP51_13050 [Blautia liquoris]|uniref:Uncharacterized protein n=1 Tax=Blautia liquoris TaxID=2779518 RepID=A0A7M2RFZ5_9FIRM|nr:hypothetical protein [Blautia liquoris]QOV18904.1 hypothetical protein INP51_13050 [Blautia liquoris]